jgi:DNA-binding NtrC family response regulator
LLMQYSWPGNIREMENFVERAVILTAGEVLQPADFNLGLASMPMTHEAASGEGLQEISARASRQAEAECIRRALARVGGNRQKAAEQLKVSARTLQAKIEEYGIEAEFEEGPGEPRERRAR